MFLPNTLPLYRSPLEAADAAALGAAGAEAAEEFLRLRDNHRATPMHALPALAANLGIGSIHIKDEGQRLGLGSFKALGGAYAVVRLVIEEAERRSARKVAITEYVSDEIRQIAATMTFSCATDGNHGRSVALGAQLVDAKAVVFVHAGVSDARIAAIARFGAEIVRVEGTYDETVREAARVAGARGWVIVSDTSWPGYERIPLLVMQGYTVIAREALRALSEPPTHVFVQSGVGGIAAAIAAHMALELGDRRPRFVVVDPDRAACIYESARAGRLVQVPTGEPTVMAMLDCYEASLIAWRILSRCADAFMTIEDDEAVAVMNRLARPLGSDPAVVAGESGGVGLAALIQAAADPRARDALGLNQASRVLVINTEGATDADRYRQLTGLAPDAVKS